MWYKWIKLFFYSILFISEVSVGVPRIDFIIAKLLDTILYKSRIVNSIFYEVDIVNSIAFFPMFTLA